MKTSTTVLFLCTSLAFLCSFAQQNSIDDAEPFRMRKINLVWHKAKKLSLSRERLNELFVDLQLQDKDERKLKQKRADGLDKDGEMEAVVQQNMARIMSKFGLDGQQSSNSNKAFDVESNTVMENKQKRDERLDKLWMAAVEEDQFTRHELEELRKELDHHHEKWRQYSNLANIVSEHEDKSGNHIRRRTVKDEETLEKLREEMNMKEKEVNNNYRRLKTKVLVSGPDQEFEDERVKQLWKKAKAQIKSNDELAIIKEELKHFDHKIAKHDDLREQLDVAEDLLEKGYDHIKAKHEKLSSKVNEHRRWIKKMHSTLHDKITSHNEL